MLTSSMDLYDKAVSALKAAINKNDAKAIENANKVVAKAGNAYLAWSKAYAADLAALNG
jgi:flagellin-specific chaperone FliS